VTGSAPHASQDAALVREGLAKAGGRVRAYRDSPAAGWVAAVAATLLTTAVMGGVLRFSRIPNISLLFLFPVVAVAGAWGRWPAIAAALLAFLSYDWFFVQPVHALTVDDPAEWLALVVLLLAAMFTANLTAALRQRAQEAQQQAWEAGTLRTLASTLAAAHDLPELLELGRQQATTVFRCISCDIDLDTDAHPAATEGELALPLRTPRGRLGLLRLVGVAGQPDVKRDIGPLLHAFAAQLALAIERLRLQEEATQAEILRRTDELRATLLSAVSHDLRTPLAAIKAAATSLLQHDIAWSEAERDGFAQSINGSADRLNRLVANLLDLSRIEAGALRLDLEEYLLEDLIGEATAQVRPLFADGQLRIEPPVDPSALHWVRVDPILIEQVLVNLLENAAKYSPAKAPVTLRARIGTDDAVLEVEDHGPGIAANEQEKVFDRFYRVTQDGRTAGTGVGLAVCKGIVEAHSGRIWVSPALGGGSTFAFSLPLDRARSTC
jgi:two-component system sensor histidine kinase KdpD